MAEGVYECAPAENAAFLSLWLRRDNMDNIILNELVIGSMALPPFDDPDWNCEHIFTMAFLLSYGRMKANDANCMLNKERCMTNAFVELLVTKISLEKIEAMIVTQARAQMVLVAAVKALFHNNTFNDVCKDVTPAARLAYHDSLTDATFADCNTWTPAISMRLLQFLALHTLSAYRFTKMTYVTHIYFAILQRGIISRTSETNIVNSIRDDTKESVIVSREVVLSIYNALKLSITSATIVSVLQHLKMFAPKALKFRISFKQKLGGSRLTSLIVIGKAIKNHPNFNWYEILNMYKDEVKSFITAASTVKGDIYYGFNYDLNLVKWTNYCNLAYVANKLETQVDGCSFLSPSFARFINSLLKARVDLLIADYKEAVTRGNVKAIQLPEMLEEIRAKIVGDWAAVYV